MPLTTLILTSNMNKTEGSLMSKWRTLLVAMLFFLLAVINVNSKTHAQQEGASGLQLVPPRSELQVNPGEKKDFSVVLKNITSGPITARAFLNDFESDNVSGEPRIIVDTSERIPYTLDGMLEGLQDVELAAGESKEIKMAINAPVNAVPGAYFGAIRFSAVPKGLELDESQRQVSLTASIAHLVLVEISGEIREQIQVESIKASRGGRAGTFFLNAPDRVGVSIKNLGNGFARPFGQVTIQGFGGREIYAYEMNVAEPRGVVLPDSSRTFSDELKNIKMPGRYTIIASVAHTNGGEVVNYTSTFWYIPLWLAVLLLALITALGLGAYILYKRRFSRQKIVTSRRR